MDSRQMWYISLISAHFIRFCVIARALKLWRPLVFAMMHFQPFGNAISFRLSILSINLLDERVCVFIAYAIISQFYLDAKTLFPDGKMRWADCKCVLDPRKPFICSFSICLWIRHLFQPRKQQESNKWIEKQLDDTNDIVWLQVHFSD